MWTNHTGHSFVFEYLCQEFIWNVIRLSSEGERTVDGVVQQSLVVTISHARKQHQFRTVPKMHNLFYDQLLTKPMLVLLMKVFETNTSIYLQRHKEVSPSTVCRAVCLMINVELTLFSSIVHDRLWSFAVGESHNLCPFCTGCFICHRFRDCPVLADIIRSAMRTIMEKMTHLGILTISRRTRTLT